MNLNLLKSKSFGLRAFGAITLMLSSSLTFSANALEKTVSVKSMADTQAPSVPTNITVTDVRNISFSVSWTPSTDDEGVLGYDLYLNDELWVSNIDGTTIELTTSFPNDPFLLDNEPKPSLPRDTTSFKIQVVAKDAAGNQSAKSSILQLNEIRYEGAMAEFSGGAQEEFNHAGYTSTGFAAGFGEVGATATFTVNVPTSGSYDIEARYGNDANDPARTFTVITNLGTAEEELFTPLFGKTPNVTIENGSWWAPTGFTTFPLSLNAGENTITFRRRSSDPSGINLASISLKGANSDYTAPTMPTVTLGNKTPTTATLNWSGATDNVGVVGYDIYQDNMMIGSTLATETTFTATGLDPDSSPVFSVRARDLAGSQSNSANITVVLSVKLEKFTAKLLNNSAKLDWSTSSEIDNDYFLIERSSDDVNFVALGKVSSKGPQGATYSFIDANPLNGTSYYRLTQFDYNGVNEILGIRSIKTDLSSDAVVSFYPNPVKNGTLTLSLGNATNDKNLKVTIVDLSGRSVHRSSFSSTLGNKTINISQLVPGIYTLSVKGDGVNFASKLFID